MPTLRDDVELAGQIGIFDTLGFETYANEQELVAILTGVTGESTDSYSGNTRPSGADLSSSNARVGPSNACYPRAYKKI